LSDTVILTRLHYPKDSNKFKQRLKIYENSVLPCLSAQEDQDFDIAVWCNPWHEKEIKALSPYIKTFSATYAPPPNPTGFNDFTEWANVSGLKEYRIQANLDSDDLIAPEYVKMIHKHCVGDASVFVGFQPYIADVRTQQVGELGPYNETFTPAFFALYQPHQDTYIFAYHTSHTRMWRFGTKTILVPYGHCCALIHDFNESTVWRYRNKVMRVAPASEIPWIAERIECPA